MKVMITLTVEVNAEKWCETYGTTKGQVRSDVHQYVRQQINDSAAADECDLVVVR